MREDDAPLVANPLVSTRELRQLHAELYSWAVSCCRGHRDEALEVLQMTYVAVMEGTARYHGESALRTFLFAVVRNTANGLRRRNWMRLRFDTLWANETPTIAAPTDSHPTEFRRVQAALRTLSERQRQVLELVYYRELSIEQAAVMMGIGVGSARTHYARGKEALRRRLE